MTFGLNWKQGLVYVILALLVVTTAFGAEPTREELEKKIKDTYGLEFVPYTVDENPDAKDFLAPTPEAYLYSLQEFLKVMELNKVEKRAVQTPRIVVYDMKYSFDKQSVFSHLQQYEFWSNAVALRVGGENDLAFYLLEQPVAESAQAVQVDLEFAATHAVIVDLILKIEEKGVTVTSKSGGMSNTDFARQPGSVYEPGFYNSKLSEFLVQGLYNIDQGLEAGTEERKEIDIHVGSYSQFVAMTYSPNAGPEQAKLFFYNSAWGWADGAAVRALIDAKKKELTDSSTGSSK